MESEGAMDFADLLLLSVHRMASGGMPPLPIRWLLVDEAQDMDEVQVEWILLHGRAGADITLVGDDDQSLYAFRHALGYAGLQKISTELSATVTTLPVNYRCAPNILAHAAKLIAHNRNRAAKKITAHREDVGEIRVIRAPDRWAEVDQIVETIEKGAQDDEWAILARTNLILDTAELALSGINRPCVRTGGKSVWEHSIGSVFSGLLRSVVDDSWTGLANALSFCGIHAEWVNEHSRRSFGGCIARLESAIEQAPDDDGSRKTLLRLRMGLASWREQAAKGRATLVIHGVAAFLSDPKRPIESTLAAMMKTAHLGDAGPHPVIASAARELLNKSDNERSGVLSTAMSFLGLYRDPVVAEVTRRCDWRIADMVGGKHPTTLYLVVPPSDINRTKPLIRLILNQVGRRLTEDLQAKSNRHRLLLMLDEFPALGRLDFFESALAFMAGYGLKAFLIAQSLNQIEKAYGPNNSILDNCHVRVSFATNDERTAKRVSDALGTATEMKAMKNYAGHRLSPWLGHMMVSRSETARQLLTPGEIMQLPPSDEIVMVAGIPPIRAKKARYYEDQRFQERILAPPTLTKPRKGQADDWSKLALPSAPDLHAPIAAQEASDDDPTESERRHQPELSRTKTVERKAVIENEFEIDPRDDVEEDAARLSRMTQTMRQVARQASLDPGDGIEL